MSQKCPLFFSRGERSGECPQARDDDNHGDDVMNHHADDDGDECGSR